MAQCVVCLQRNNPFPLPGMAVQPRTVLNEAGGVSHPGFTTITHAHPHSCYGPGTRRGCASERAVWSGVRGVSWGVRNGATGAVEAEPG